MTKSKLRSLLKPGLLFIRKHKRYDNFPTSRDEDYPQIEKMNSITMYFAGGGSLPKSNIIFVQQDEDRVTFKTQTKVYKYNSAINKSDEEVVSENFYTFTIND